MSATTLSPHLVAVVRTALADKTPMTAIAREHNISVHRVRKIRDEGTRTIMTREQANLWVLGVFAKWNSERIDALEREVNYLLGTKPSHDRDTTICLPKVNKEFIPYRKYLR